VLWNGAARTTTFVGATQLSAAIPATDLAKTGAVTITVANPAPGGTSAAVTFTVTPNIAAALATLGGVSQTFTTVKQITDIQPGLVQALSDTKTYLSFQDAAISDLHSQLSAEQTRNSTLAGQNADLNSQVATLQATVAQLQARVDAAKIQTASPLEVAQSFKGVLDTIQQAALNGGGVQTTLTSMNVQLKAVVSMQTPATGAPQALLVFPDPTALPDPNSLSTVTLSFGAIPNLKAPATPGS
jgi:outer membrane murein-binding lipoprotein Lpp